MLKCQQLLVCNICKQDKFNVQLSVKAVSNLEDRSHLHNIVEVLPRFVRYVLSQGISVPL